MKQPRPRRSRKRPAFPRDGEVREALLESGMGLLAVERAMSQLLRPLRCDFFVRRKRRLYNIAAMRMGLVQLKEKAAAIAAQHEKDTGTALNVDDFFFGPYKYLLTDFGPGDVDKAINELVRDGVLRPETRGGIQVLLPTRKPCRHSITRLRRVLDQMKLHLGIRYAQEYDTERTYQM
jgi:hypothetical protein